MNRPQVHVIAPAKINLFLDIVGTREDGYHLLEMVMQSVSLADEVRLRAGRAGIRLTCSREELSTGPDNLAWKAAEAFCLEADIEPALDITLTKSIPSQAGLGGGSSDAAAVLRGLNELYDVGFPTRRLMEIGAKIGADVPFCLTGGTAHVQGIGEQVKPAAPMPDCLIVLAKPVCGISTKDAYARFDSCGQSLPHGDLNAMQSALAAGDLHDTAAAMHNTFEHLHEERPIIAILETMRQFGALGQLMTGSGSACFAVFDDKRAAKRCYRHLREISQGVFLCRPCRYGALVLL